MKKLFSIPFIMLALVLITGPVMAEEELVFSDEIKCQTEFESELETEFETPLETKEETPFQTRIETEGVTSILTPVQSAIALTHNEVLVFLENGQEFVLQLFSKGSKKPKIELVNNNTALIALKNNGKAIRSFDLTTLERISHKKLRKKNQNRTALEVYNFDDENVVIAATKRNKTVRVTSYRLTVTNKLKTRSTKKFHSSKNNKKLTISSSYNKTLEKNIITIKNKTVKKKYIVTKKGNLKLKP